MDNGKIVVPSDELYGRHMMESVIRLPEKRTAVLYSRVTPRNKKFVEEMAKQSDVSESVLIDHILDKFREQNEKKSKARK